MRIVAPVWWECLLRGALEEENNLLLLFSILCKAFSVSAVIN